jgi:hypothetical protein
VPIVWDSRQKNGMPQIVILKAKALEEIRKEPFQ